MAASRETQSIWYDIKKKNWSKLKIKLKVIFNFFNFTLQDSLLQDPNRHNIIKDSFTTPFNKKFGCRVFGHRWSTPEEEQKYDFDTGYHHCWKCSKWITDSQMRDEKLKKLLK